MANKDIEASRATKSGNLGYQGHQGYQKYQGYKDISQRPEGTMTNIGTIRVAFNRTNYLLNILLHSFESLVDPYNIT